MSPGVFVRRVWDRIRPDTLPWDRSCAVGEPVPEEERCRALDCPTVRVTELREGARATVSCLEAPGGPAARKLAALGLLPGTDLVLVQTFPVWVLRSGYAEIALDRGLAEHVRVHVLEAD